MTISTLLYLAIPAALAAGPVSTVPWNGHRGAISFTFDDSYPSQLRYVVPALDKRGIHATFFMVGSSWTSDRAAWIQAARGGHELGNHTLTHASLGGLDSAGVEREISGMADSLRAADSSIQAVTIAYPYCATTDLIDRISDRQAIVARTCGWNPLYNPRYGWNAPPAKWMEATSLGITDTATVRQALTEIDRTDSAGAWLVTLNHGIMDQSYGPISDTAVEAMFDRALARNLWIATYQDVAAYWRASAVVDTARAVADADGWTVSWTSPHPRMPRSVPLRLRLDTATFGTSFSVRQDGAAIAPGADGAFVVDFMKLSLRVSSAPTAATRHAAARVRLRRIPSGLAIDGLEPGVWEASSILPSGRTAESWTLRAGTGSAPVVPESVRAVSVLRLRSATGTVMRILVPPRI